MARKQSAYPIRPNNHQPRHQPYVRNLPIRDTPLFPGPSIEPHHEPWDEAAEIRYEIRQAFAQHGRTPHVEDPPTPNSTLSSDSISRNLSPCLTNASLAVECSRHLTPFGVATPGSEDSSGFVYINPPYQPGPTYEYAQPLPSSGHWHNHRQSAGIGKYKTITSTRLMLIVPVTPPESTGSSVVGIIPSPETESFPQRRLEFISPHGPIPTQQQQIPRHTGPWSGYPLRQDDLMVIDSTPSPSSQSSVLSPGSNPERGARRLGPLSSEGRKNANQVRDIGACLRCSSMKERCDKGMPCSNCRDKKTRKWKMGCVRDQLDTRTHLLFPPPIKDRYNLHGTNNYVDNSGFFYLDRPAFTLNLTTGLKGVPIPVWVKEIEPVNHERLLRSYKANTANGNNDAEQFWDPPIALYRADKHHDRKSFHDQIENILIHSMIQALEAKHDNGYWWPWRCFDFKDMDWLGEIVETIHTFSQECKGVGFFASIRKASSLLLFNYLLDHPFLIEGNEREKLAANLSNPPACLETEWVSSEVVTRSLKAVVFPPILKGSSEVLKELHELLLQISKNKEMSSARNDLAFCLSFLMLVLLGQNQARLVLLADMATNGETGVNLGPADAEKHIRDMETQLGDFIIQFHEFALKKRRKPQGPSGDLSKIEEQVSARFGLMGKVAAITREYRVYTRPPGKVFVKAESPAEACKPASFDLNEFSVESFEARNIQRLCWKFVDAIIDWSDENDFKRPTNH